jgi:hypothetical protein
LRRQRRRVSAQRKWRHGGADANERLAAAGDEEVLAPGGLVEPVTEVVAEVVAGDGQWRRFGGVELEGLEPSASGVPRRRSGQLSYSPFEFEVVSKVNACPLTVEWRREPRLDGVLAGSNREREQKAAVELTAIHAEQVDLIHRVGAAQ